MAQQACEYFVARYYDNPVRQEPKNIGIILWVPETRLVTNRFLTGMDLRKKLAGLPELDTQVLHDSLNDLQKKLVDFQQRDFWGDSFFAKGLADLWVGNVEISSPRRVVSDNPNNELRFLFETFVTPAKEQGSQVTGYQLKQDLRVELQDRSLLARGRELREDRFVSDPEIKSTHSGAKHRVDFAMQNGVLRVIETVDMRKKNIQEIEREAFGAAVKLDDLRRGVSRGKFEGLTLVAGSSPRSDRNYFLKVLGSYADDVVDYSDEADRNRFWKHINRAIGSHAR